MRNLLRNAIVTMGLAVLVGVGTAGVMAQDKEAIIKDRRDAMKKQGADMKAIGDWLKGEAGDQAAALAAANDLVALNPKIIDLFAPGTSLAEFPGKTGAKPEIWKEWDKFKTLPAGLLDEEKKLVEAVKGGDKAAIGAQLGATGKNGCGTCHTPYREKLS
jgi:cytochrome c556